MKEKNICIRRANTSDAADLVKLNDNFNGVGMSIDEVKDSFTLTNELIALAVIDDLPVGFACAHYFKSFCYHGLQGEITELYITEVARKRGLGTLLIAFLEEELRVLHIYVIEHREDYLISNNELLVINNAY